MYLLTQILRLMKGYDELCTILLPPRPPGEKLPSELTEYYEGLRVPNKYIKLNKNNLLGTTSYNIQEF